MTYQRRAVTFALIGIISILSFNAWVVFYFVSNSRSLENADGIMLNIGLISNLAKLVCFALAVAGVVYGIKSLKEKSRLGILGILLCCFLVFLVFVPFWEVIVENSALGININP